jgi:plastocyanin
MKRIIVVLGTAAVMAAIAFAASTAIAQTYGTSAPAPQPIPQPAAPQPTLQPAPSLVVWVSIRDFFFNPSQITIVPGTTVVWVNEGNHPHTVTANDGSFDSETLLPGQSFMATFQGRGTISYFCEIHPFMRGSVTVSSGSSRKGITTTTAEARAGSTEAIAEGS